MISNKESNVGTILLTEDSKYGGPLEPQAGDPLEGRRREERQAHQAKKKQLKRHWKKIKDKQVSH